MRIAVIAALALLCAVLPGPAGAADEHGWRRVGSDARAGGDPAPPVLADAYTIRMNSSHGDSTLEYYDYGRRWQRFDTGAAPPPLGSPSHGAPPAPGVQVELTRFDLLMHYSYNASHCQARAVPPSAPMQPPTVLVGSRYEGRSLLDTHSPLGRVLCDAWFVTDDSPTPYTFYTEATAPHDPVALVQGSYMLVYFEYDTVHQLSEDLFAVPRHC